MKEHGIKRRDFLKSVGASALCGPGLAAVMSGSGAAVADDGYLLRANEFSVNKSVFATARFILLKHLALEHPVSLLRIPVTITISTGKATTSAPPNNAPCG